MRHFAADRKVLRRCVNEITPLYNPSTFYMTALTMIIQVWPGFWVTCDATSLSILFHQELPFMLEDIRHA
jgi:hypothetical protein